MWGIQSACVKQALLSRVIGRNCDHKSKCDNEHVKPCTLHDEHYYIKRQLLLLSCLRRGVHIFYHLFNIFHIIMSCSCINISHDYLLCNKLKSKETNSLNKIHAMYFGLYDSCCHKRLRTVLDTPRECKTKMQIVVYTLIVYNLYRHSIGCVCNLEHKDNVFMSVSRNSINRRNTYTGSFFFM